MNYEIRNEGASGDIVYEWRRGTEDTASDTHRQGYYEIYYLTRGSGLYLVGNNTYNIDEGDILLIPEGVEHRTVEADEYRERHTIACRPQYIPRSVRERLGGGASVIRSPGARAEIDAILARIAREHATNDEHRDDALRCLVGELMILLARCENLYKQSENSSPAVAIAITYVKEHYSDRISLPDVARVCKVSTAYLSRKFKEEVGVGFSDYLSGLRLRHAAAMLTEMPEASITEVAFACGFNDSNYFSDKFKRRYGASPLKFKRG